MSLYDSEILTYDFTPKAPAGHKGLILVLSDRHDDTYLVSELLGQSGYVCETNPDPKVIDGNASCNSSAAGCEIDAVKEYAATILCHRTLGQRASVIPSLEQLPGRRIIAITDCTDEQMAVSLFESGAHHVFDMRESKHVLQARLQAALRQHSHRESSSFTLGDIHFDVPKRQVSRAGVRVNLSPKEFDLAYYLFSNRDRVVGNSELMTSIWSLPPSMDTRRIDTAACRLRKKLQLSASHGWELRRLRRIGYQLVPAAAPDVAELQSHPDDDEFSASLRTAAG